VKAVQHEFSSSVPICRNKGNRSDLGATYLPGAPPAGGYGGPILRLCAHAALKAKVFLQHCIVSSGI